MKKFLTTAFTLATLFIAAPAANAQCLICGIIGFGIGASTNNGQANPITQSLAAIPFRCLYVAEKGNLEDYTTCRTTDMYNSMVKHGWCTKYEFFNRAPQKKSSVEACRLEYHAGLEYEALQALITAVNQATTTQQ